ncbi:hypothetical protein ACWGF2_13355 [Streptomyces sp. NPDC054919]
MAATSEFAPVPAPSVYRLTRSPHSAVALPSPRTVAGWILRHLDSLTDAEQLRLQAVLVRCPERVALTRHVRSFAQILTERRGDRLPEWLDAVHRDDLSGLRTLQGGEARLGGEDGPLSMDYAPRPVPIG